MAEESGQERTEEPTPKRLEDARRKGQIPRSRELNTLAVLMAGVVGLGIFSRSLGEGLAKLMRVNFRLEREDLLSSDALLEHAAQALLDGLLLLAPLLLVAVIAALAAPLMLGGWVFSLENLAPKFAKLNPWEGFKRMFSWRSLVELLKSFLKVVLIASVAGIVLKVFQPQLVELSGKDLKPALAEGLEWLWQASLVVSVSLLAIAEIDVPYQLWDWRNKLKMTVQEIKEELKESEGRPEVKSKIRQLQRERAQRRMMEEIPKASVVVTNPTHFAVALQYDSSQRGAPKVVAKGVDLIAYQIRTRAISAGVPLVEAPSLARALYYSTELGQEIPQGLYLAVAQVLAYVYQLKTARGREFPPLPRDLPVPEEYLHPDGKRRRSL
jgi:flagellar biosynthetic protein FlhB